MEIEFRRSGERRYEVVVRRADLPPLVFGGPGYDPAMPHDLAHFIVESELGLTHGIFGFLAAGGDGARGAQPGEDHRQAARRRSRAARRDEKLSRRGGRADGDQSERATHVCVCEWLRRSGDPRRRERARELMVGRADLRDFMTDNERAALSDEVLADVCARMDELSGRWASLAVGESLSLEWRPRRRTPRGRASA